MVISHSKTPNYVISWGKVNGDLTCHKDIYEDRKNYFLMLRALISDLDDLAIPQVDKILKKHKVEFIGIDDFPRVNLDIPAGCKTWGER